MFEAIDTCARIDSNDSINGFMYSRNLYCVQNQHHYHFQLCSNEIVTNLSGMAMELDTDDRYRLLPLTERTKKLGYS